MEFLRLMGVGSDGSALILTGSEGKQFRLVVDEALRMAVRSSRVLPPATNATTLALPPREIQARLRAGATAADVARDAGVPVEKVQRYETPILAERAHVANLAENALVRRPASGTGQGIGARTLREVLADHIEPDGYHADALNWDAWRREDGRWMVQVGLPTDPDRPTVWIFEPPARAVSPGNDSAREVLAERGNHVQRVEEAPTASIHELRPHRDESPTVAAVSMKNSPAQTTLDEVFGEASAHETVAATKPAAAGSSRSKARARVELPERAAVGETPRPASSRSSRRKPSVPAWDDILFGSRPEG